MFVGHFAAAYAARRIVPQSSLGTLFFAAQFLDLLWPLLVLAGIERVSLAPQAAVFPLVFEHYPWSHSLLFALAWGVVIGGLYWRIRRDRIGAVAHVIELALLAGGVALYLAATRPERRAGIWGACFLITLLMTIQVANTFGPPSPGPMAVAWTAMAMWLLVLLGWWTDGVRR